MTVAMMDPHLASAKRAKMAETMVHSTSIKEADPASQMLSWVAGSTSVTVAMMDTHSASTKEADTLP